MVKSRHEGAMKRNRVRWQLCSVGFVVCSAGCDTVWSNVAEDCEFTLMCEHHRGLWDGTGGSVPNPECEADPTENASSVRDECAVFASATAEPGGDGTKANPYASLGEAVANAGNKRVLACASGAFAESVTIEAGVEVIGGFDCDAEWTWSEEARSGIEAPANQIALTVSEAASGAKVRSFSVRAASATEPGGSSIGVAVADVEAELAQVDVTAGDGMAGEDGTTPTEAPLAGAGAPSNVSNACTALVYGDDPGVTACEDGETRGGVGGLGGITTTEGGNGLKGADGAPLPEPNVDASGLGGTGQTDPDGDCKPGTVGKSGARGMAGATSTDTTLTLASIVGGDGENGTVGTRGQGGGGGGGAKAGLFCPGPSMSTVEGVGASGGGGGAGGCGGKGGGGGQAGGSSIGIISLGTKLVLADVTVAVGEAGKGGNGAAGQLGGSGGAGAAGGTAPAAPAIPGCKGGDGGRGGAGGPGAGGRGGHALGIAYAAAASATLELKEFMMGTAGDGGSAGPGGSEQSAGAQGASGVCWNFATNESCGQ
ncbi:hypothetical protein ACSRUE_45075 [Sorangium sp. KYC3313]|uniref:hypothetical protein n=1 Tax=Sorangium sp. KYC3313 TaxID=3449740 RepID=UPI003F896FCE